MYYKTIENKKGVRFEVLERYKNPLTGKWKTASVSYTKDTSRARRQAERELKDKIDDILDELEGIYNNKKIETFGQLKEDWLSAWSATVKEKTVARELLVLNKLSDIIGDDYLLDKITPLLLRKALDNYIEQYNPSQATLQHAKSCLNKIFDHGVLYGIITFSPMTSVKVTVSSKKKKEVRVNRDKKFLEIHEISVLFNELSMRRNPNYYDLAIFLLFSGLRIGEAGSLEDVDFENETIDVSTSLQSTDLKVAEFYDDDTKTSESDRLVKLPKVAIDALKRVIERNKKFDEYAEKNPRKSFKKSKKIFRTEYGAPITSHSFREVLNRIEKDLIENCKERYGFEWTKHAVPHSFRHMHITYLQSSDFKVALKEIMGRVGHVNSETTMVYTHRTMSDQEKSVSALNNFAETSGIEFKALKTWTTRHSNTLFMLIDKNKNEKSLRFSLDEFRDKIGISKSYEPRHISANIFPKMKKDLSQYYDEFKIETLRGKGRKVLGYEFTWK